MHILLTNDDGINAHGLRALHKAFIAAGHKVTTVAPDSQQSGISSAVSLHSPLRIETRSSGDFIGYAVKGMPVDCVKIALHTLMHDHGGLPDIIVSGMNAGRNIGVDVFYSGTMGAAMEGVRQGIPSIAISHANYCPASVDDLLQYTTHATQLIERLDWKSIPKERVLNLNYPNIPMTETQGLQVCATDTTPWHDIYEKRHDPIQNPYWWLGGYSPAERLKADSDHVYLTKGWVTLSALSLDLNDTSLQQSLRESLGKHIQ